MILFCCCPTSTLKQGDGRRGGSEIAVGFFIFKICWSAAESSVDAEMLKLLVLIPVLLLLLGHRRLGFLVEAATAAASSSAKNQDQSSILLVVSYDSFRNKYLEYGLTPSLKKVQQEGVSVPYMRNVFTTKTFPNHFSIATGLYPDKHGVVNSVIFDHKVGELKYGQEYYGMDKRVTPIWVRATMSVLGHINN